MSDSPLPPAGRSAAPSVSTLLDRLVRRARWALAFERVWPALVLAVGLVAAFLAVSWLGIWVVLPRDARMAGVALFGAGLAVAAVLAARQLRVTRRDALVRLDRDAGVPHRPVSSAEDRLANAGTDPMTRALWDLSRRRVEATLARVRLRPPAPHMAVHDPFALRAAAVLALVAAAFVAGDHKDGLVMAAFDWRDASAAGPGFRVDVWVDPPPYTGKAPIVLLAGHGGGAESGQTVAVPVHSVVVVRSSGEGGVTVVPEGELKAMVVQSPPGGTPAGAAAHPAGGAAVAAEHRFTLDGNGRLTLAHGGAPVGRLALTAIPDQPPTIVLNEKPKATDRGGLTLSYAIADDYGVTSAEAAFSEPSPAAGAMVRSLVPAPKLALNLPPTPGGLGRGQTTGDLSDHPWAGATVTMVLSARDEGGNVGLSPPTRMTLPARSFSNPLARSLVEQRRDLVFDPDHRDGIATALDALMIEPDLFGTTKAVYLGLYTARQRLAAARNDDDLTALADYLWQMALRVEDGDKSAAAKDLQAAEQALREALSRNAPPDEIRRLTEDLQRKMERLLAEMAQDQQNAQDQPPAGPLTRTVTPDQLRQMMQRMQDLARNGDTAEAQRMLDQLQAMLDNLKSARKSGASQAQRDMNRQMGELNKMTRDQQALRDQTFQRGQGTGAPDDQQPGDDDDDAAQNGAPRQSGQPQPDAQAQQGTPSPGADSGDLQGQQGGLRERLGALKKRMRQLGLKGEKGLDDAEQAMKDAEGALGKGATGNGRAVEAQGRALQGLQQGANGLAQQMAQRPGEGQGQGQGEGQGQAQGEQPGDGQGGSSISQGNPGQDGTDPLGRQRDGRGTLETQGRALDQSVAERARRVLQELRRRLGDPDRPSEEMDYLERLLQRY